MNSKFRCAFGLGIGMLLVSFVAMAYPQGSGSSRSDRPRATRPQTPNEFHQTFWEYIVKKDAAYNTWKELSRAVPAEDVENPHGSDSATHANKVAAANPRNLPVGSILVREDYDEKRHRVSISVLYRVKDFDKQHGNWYWIKYLENGSVARNADRRMIAGTVASCIECHSKAGGRDFVFSNDVAPNSSAKE
jgi:hypothetical protein